LAEIFIVEIPVTAAGLLTVTKVKMSSDLKIAKVYVSFLNNTVPADRVMEIIEEKKKAIRYQVGTRLRARFVPELRFFHDDTLAQAERIETLIRKLHEDEDQ